MLRSIGSVTVLALLMVGCGGGGGDSSPPPPPPGAIGGTVSGLVGTGLTLYVCRQVSGHGGGYCIQNTLLQIRANGAFTLYPVYPADSSGTYSLSISQQPSSPVQRCELSGTNVATVGSYTVLDFNFQTANSTSLAVSCADVLEYSYVTNAADNTVSSYSVDVTTGAVAVIGAPTVTGASPYAIVGVDKRYVFVGNEGSNDVSAFAINSTTGAWTAVPGSPFPAGTDPRAMALADNNILYVANAGSDNVSAYSIDQTSGTLTVQPGSPVAAGKSPTSIVIDYFFSSYVFVANHGGSNDISVFSIDDPTTGALTPVVGSPFPAGGNPLSLALGAGGKFLYSANPDATNPSISGFSVDPPTHALSPLSGSPFPLPVSHYMASDKTGSYLYVTSGTNIVGYAIDATTGALTPLPGFPVAAGANAYSITVDSANQVLYVTNDGAANVSCFTLDATTGALTPMAGSPFPAGNRPEFIATF